MSKREKLTISRQYSNKICRAVVMHMVFCIIIALDVIVFNDALDILIFSLALAVVDCIGFIRAYSKMLWVHRALQDIYNGKSEPTWYHVIAKDALDEMNTKDLY